MQQQIEKRIELLKQQLEQTNSQILTVSENLNQLKNQANQIIGHLNEAQYLLSELYKTQPNNDASENTIPYESLDDNAHVEHENINA